MSLNPLRKYYTRDWSNFLFSAGQNVGLMAELDRSRLQVKDYKEELNFVHLKFDEQINELTTAKSVLEERLKEYFNKNEELTALNEVFSS